MKPKIVLIGFVVLLAATFLMPMDVVAQGNKKPKGPPNWAPAHGYRAKTRHIYFPDNNFYFDTQKNVYIYLSGNQWQVSIKLPSLFASIDLKGAVQVELELYTNAPQKFNAEHKFKHKAKTKIGLGKGNKKRGKKKGKWE
jgi:hypothetical protein